MKTLKSYTVIGFIIFLAFLVTTASAKEITLVPAKGINISNIQFAAGGPEHIRSPAVFAPGEHIIITFDVTGYKIVNKNVSVKGDLVITGPKGKVILKEDDTIDYTGPAKKMGKKGVASLALSNNAPFGQYTLEMTIRDLLDNKQLKVKETFSVK